MFGSAKANEGIKTERRVLQASLLACADYITTTWVFLQILNMESEKYDPV